MMDIIGIAKSAIEPIPFICASSDGKTINSILPILEAKVDSLPDGMDAIIATGDLQGIDVNKGQLLGYRVAEVLEKSSDRGIIPSKNKMGIILAGDLWAKPDRKGGVGDVRGVWQAMASRFSWVAGVGGNHDCFGNSSQDMKEFKSSAGIHYLDGEIMEVNGLRLAGISGIIGKATKHFRRPEKEFIKLVRNLIKKSPDILILHEGPGDREAKLMGRESIRKALIDTKNLVTICGHSHWKIPIKKLPQGASIVNVDGRVIIFKKR